MKVKVMVRVSFDAYRIIILIKLISEIWKRNDITKRFYGARNSSSETINRL